MLGGLCFLYYLYVELLNSFSFKKNLTSSVEIKNSGFVGETQH